MIEDDTLTSFSTEDSVDEVPKPKTKKQRQRKNTLKKLNKESFKTRTNILESPKTVIKLSPTPKKATKPNKNKQTKGGKTKINKSLDTKTTTKKNFKVQKTATLGSTPITVFTKTILEALYDLNSNQKWQKK